MLLHLSDSFSTLLFISPWILGYVDDVLIVVIGAGLLLRSIPPKVLDEHVSRFEATAAGPDGTGRRKPPRGLPSGG